MVDGLDVFLVILFIITTVAGVIHPEILGLGVEDIPPNTSSPPTQNISNNSPAATQPPDDITKSSDFNLVYWQERLKNS